jgi:hypothetical protein
MVEEKIMFLIPGNVCCFKYGEKYPPIYVERLYKMVKRHLSEPFEFHCFTEDATGISNPAIQIHPLIDTDFKGAWHQATIFKPDIGIKGKILYLDLDIVIVDSIDALIEQPGDFVINKDWNLAGVYNGSAFMFEAGALPDAWATLQDIKDVVKDTELGAQRFITDFFRNKASFWPEGWIVSYKKHAVGGYPEGAKIVVFHGDPKPDKAMWGWGNVPPEPWIIEHWGGPI